MRASILALLSLLLLLPVWAVNIHGTIRWNEVCPGSSALCCKCALDHVTRSSVEFDQLGQSNVILDNGIYTGTITRSGSFVM